MDPQTQLFNCLDVLSHIFVYLNFFDVMCCSFVCKKWYYATKSNKVWGKLFIELLTGRSVSDPSYYSEKYLWEKHVRSWIPLLDFTGIRNIEKVELKELNQKDYVDMPDKISQSLTNQQRVFLERLFGPILRNQITDAVSDEQDESQDAFEVEHLSEDEDSSEREHRQLIKENKRLKRENWERRKQTREHLRNMKVLQNDFLERKQGVKALLELKKQIQSSQDGEQEESSEEDEEEGSCSEDSQSSDEESSQESEDYLLEMDDTHSQNFEQDDVGRDDIEEAFQDFDDNLELEPEHKVVDSVLRCQISKIIWTTLLQVSHYTARRKYDTVWKRHGSFKLLFFNFRRPEKYVEILVRESFTTAALRSKFTSKLKLTITMHEATKLPQESEVISIKKVSEEAEDEYEGEVKCIQLMYKEIRASPDIGGFLFRSKHFRRVSNFLEVPNFLPLFEVAIKQTLHRILDDEWIHYSTWE